MVTYKFFIFKKFSIIWDPWHDKEKSKYFCDFKWELITNLGGGVAVFNGVVDGEEERVQRRQQLDDVLVKKLFRQNDFWRHVAHQESVVRRKEAIEALLAFPDSLGVGVQADQLKGVALLEVDANAGTEST